MQTILPALRALLFALATLALAGIGGCGLKGDLSLPEPGNASSPQEGNEEKASDDESGSADGART